MQNLRQSLLAEFGSSTGAGRQRSQFENLLARHGDHLLPKKASNATKLAERVGIEPTPRHIVPGQRF